MGKLLSLALLQAPITLIIEPNPTRDNVQRTGACGCRWHVGDFANGPCPAEVRLFPRVLRDAPADPVLTPAAAPAAADHRHCRSCSPPNRGGCRTAGPAHDGQQPPPPPHQVPDPLVGVPAVPEADGGVRGRSARRPSFRSSRNPEPERINPLASARPAPFDNSDIPIPGTGPDGWRNRRGHLGLPRPVPRWRDFTRTVF